VVDKLAAVIGIDPLQRKWEALSNTSDSFEGRVMALVRVIIYLQQ
jgi:hypothetical protein